MLIAGFLTGHELPSLIETIFSSKDEGNTIRCLPRDDAQTFIDVMDEVRSAFVLSVRIDAESYVPSSD